MTPGPSMKTARSHHGCGKLRDESILVVGGYKKSLMIGNQQKHLELETFNGPTNQIYGHTAGKI